MNAKMWTVRYTLPGVRGIFSVKVTASNEAEALDTARWGLANQYMSDARITSVRPTRRAARQ